MMNKRIWELVEQSHVTMDVEYRADRRKAERLDIEKLVGLAVKECMKLNHDILCEDDPDYLDEVYKEHFGIE
jgi:hypothetical protein